MSGRPIFRERAIAAHRKATEKDIVPRMVYWPIITCCWFLLGIDLAAGCLAWYIRIPAYVDARGIILGGQTEPHSASDAPVAVVFLPPLRAMRVRVGQPVEVQIGSDMYLHGVIGAVERSIVSPSAAREQYALDAVGALLVTEPSVVMTVGFAPAALPDMYMGSVVRVKVETGSQRLLELLPGLTVLVSSSV